MLTEGDCRGQALNKDGMARPSTAAASVTGPTAPHPSTATITLRPLTSSASPYINVGSTRVYGLPVDHQTRCVHWHSPVDIVALSHPCCERFYPCADCHDAVTEHMRTTWPRAEQRPTVLCGACGNTMTAKEYMGADGCPVCQHPFNPKCALHRNKYFGPA